MVRNCAICGPKHGSNRFRTVPNDEGVLDVLKAYPRFDRSTVWRAEQVICLEHFIDDKDTRMVKPKDKSLLWLWTESERALNVHAMKASTKERSPSQPQPKNVKKKVEKRNDVKKRLSSETHWSATALPMSPPNLKRVRRHSDTTPDAEKVIADLKENVMRLQAKLEEAQRHIKELQWKHDVGHLTWESLKRHNVLEDVTKVPEQDLIYFCDLLKRPMEQAETRNGFGLGETISYYTLPDYVVWTFAFSGSFGKYSSMTPFLPKIDIERIKRKIEWVAKELAKQLGEQIKWLPANVSKEHGRRAIKDTHDEFVKKLLMEKMAHVIDGSDVPVYKSTSADIAHYSFCWFKHEHQFRFQAVCSALGYMEYLGPPDIGHQSDTAAINKDNEFRKTFNEHYNLKEKKGRLEEKDDLVAGQRKNGGTCATHVIIADQGYPGMKVPAMTDIVCTRTAEDAECWNRVGLKKYAIASPHIACVRGVVERVFGRMQQLSTFIKGPVLNSQIELAYNFIKIYCAIFNRRILEGEQLFVNEESNK